MNNKLGDQINMSKESLPSWFGDDFMESFLTESGTKADETKVVNLEIKSRLGVEKTHFSNIYRVKAELNLTKNGETKTVIKYLVIKERSSDKFIRDVVEGGKLVEKEYLMYKEILPLMKKTMNNFYISPKYYDTKLPNIFVLEDLNERGYSMCDRLKGLDFDHSAKFMEALASFHAVSVAIHKQNPIMIMSIGEEYLHTLEESHNDDFVSSWVTKFYKAVETWDGYERYSKMIHDLITTFPDRLHEVFTLRKHLNVLNHGDTWTNNILFKYNPIGEVMDVKLLDYQVCRYASPALDLQYFTWTSIQEDVRIHKIKQLYSIYLKSLNSHLEHLGCEERLTESELQNEIDFTGIFIIYIIIFVLPFILNDPDNIIRLEENDYLFNIKNKENDHITNIFKSKYFVSTVKSMLKELESKGIIK
uniref:CHK kinase-like domain-containing protein n=1 Tax=Clastoptera arizonana TaxID=38151 RepID=A0A1B6EF94_9HEMI